MRKQIIFALALVALIVAASPASRRSRTPNVQKVIIERIEGLEKQVRDLEKRVIGLEIKLNPNLKMKEDGKEKRITSRLDVGQLVFFGDLDRLKVLQVVDARNVIGEITIRENRNGRIYSSTENVWINNIDTSKMVDEGIHKIPADLIFKIAKTKTYQTVVGGSRTIYELQCLPEKKDRKPDRIR